MADLGMYINVQGKGIREVSKELDGLTDSAARTEQAASQLGLATDEYQKRLRGLQGIAKAYKVDQEQIASASMRVTQANFELVNSENQVIAATMRVSDSAEQAGISMNDYLKRLERMKKAAYAAGSTQAELANSYLHVSDKAYHLVGANNDVIRTLARGSEQSQSAAIEANKLANSLKEPVNAFNSLGIAANKSGMSVEAQAAKMQEMVAAAKANSASLNELNGAQMRITSSGTHLVSEQGKVLHSMASSADSVSASLREAAEANMQYLQSLAKAQGYSYDRNNRLHAANGKFAKESDEVAQEIKKTEKALFGAAGAAGHFSQELDKTGQQVSRTSIEFGALKRAVAGYVSLQTIKTMFAWADSMNSIRSQIGFVTDSTSEAAKVQEELLGISNRTYASMEATATLYTRTARALDGYGKSQKEILKFTEAVNNAMRVGGVGAQEQASALLQLSQALGSGRLQGDEFRSISEAAPIMLDILSKYLNVTRDELRKLASDGKLTGDIIFQAMIQAGDGLLVMANKMPKTVGGSLQVLENQFKSFTSEIMNGSGVYKVVPEAILLIANNLDKVLIPAVMLIASVAMPLLSKATVIASNSFKSLFMMLKGSPIGMVVMAIVSLAAATGNLEGILQQTGQFFGEFFDTVSYGFDNLGQLAEAVFLDIKAYADNSAKDSSSSFSDAFKGLESLFSNTGGGFYGFLIVVGRTLDLAAVTIKSVFDYVTTALAKIGQYLYDNVLKRIFPLLKLLPNIKIPGADGELNFDKNLETNTEQIMPTGMGAYFEDFQKRMQESGKAAEEAANKDREKAEATKDATEAEKKRSDSILKTISSLEEQMRESGKTQSEVIGMRAAINGATTEQLSYIKSLQDVIAANEAYAKVIEKLKGLDYRVETLGMSSREKELYDLEKAGASRQDLAYADRQLRTIEQFEESQKKLTESAGVMKNAADISLEAAIGEKAKAEKAIDQVSYYGPRKSDAEIFGYGSSSFGGKPSAGFNGKMPATGGLPKNIPSRAAQGDTQQTDTKSQGKITIEVVDGAKSLVGELFGNKEFLKLFDGQIDRRFNLVAKQVTG